MNLFGIILSILLYTIVDALGASNVSSADWKNDPSCGISFDKRIVGGYRVRTGKYPWLVRIGFKTEDPRLYKFVCGGSLISERLVLTAAHCKSNLKPGVVRVGETEIKCITSPCSDERVQEIPIKNVISHQGFRESDGFSDIAILELEYPAVYTDYVRPICLTKNYLGNVGDKALVAGWGVENNLSKYTPRILKVLTIEIVDKDKCKKAFAQADFSSNNYICAGGKVGEDSCSGDSGGPLMKILNLDGTPRMYLLGAISFGTVVCGTGAPGIYTSVGYHMPWIMDELSKLA